MIDFDDFEEAAAEAEKQEEDSAPSWPPLDRNMRVLAIHGQGANSNIMKVQTDLLRSVCKEGELSEWDYIDGEEWWDWEGAGNSYTDPASESDKRHQPQPQIMIGMAQGMPFLGWYRVECKDHSARHWLEKICDTAVTYTADERLEASCERVLEHIKEKGPFDIVVAFSSATVVLNVLTGMLRERDETPPWRLSVLFSPVRVRDERFKHLFSPVLTQPAVISYGKVGDDWANHYAKKDLSQWMFKNPTVLPDGEHGHEIPRVGHDQKRTCMRVAQHMFRCCGMKPPFPTKIARVVEGGGLVEEDL